MNILITGANGLLGKSLIDRLSKNHNIYAIVGKHSTLEKSANITILKVDLVDLDTDKLPKYIDAIYYLAQSNNFREFPEMAMDMLSINVYTPVKLALWGQKCGVKKFIYASSGGVYKHPTQSVKEMFDINANVKNGFYLDSKLSGEILLRNFSDLFKTFVIVRPFFMYGPRQNKSMLIPRLMFNIIDGNDITLSYKDGIQINPIFVDDASASMEKLIDLEGEHIFNIAGNEIVSLRELSTLISNIVNKEAKYKVLEDSQADLIADITRMQEMLHDPKVKLKEGLALVHKVMYS
jgi:nucleoside-diphosphate-sugar epimerase